VRFRCILDRPPRGGKGNSISSKGRKEKERIFPQSGATPPTQRGKKRERKKPVSRGRGGGGGVTVGREGDHDVPIS